MSFKDDPVQQQSKFAPRELWLNQGNMQLARANFWKAYNEAYPTGVPNSVGNTEDERTWNIAFAAAVAAFSFMMEGRTEPRA